ncbi:MAG: preprotein translocase subunit SecY [Alphaproteobacteria bacterium]|nr:preprotein translocase subunit SecY [Alphaproteobacteria bacterium]
MASTAEQLVQNLNFGAFAKAKELQQRILFTLGALIVYRIGTYIPLPGINPEEVARLFQNLQGGIGGMVNVFTGGAIERMAIFALNIMPYISASIIMQLMTTVSRRLEALKKEGEQGRKQINQYTRYLTVVLAMVQAFAIAVGLQNAGSVVASPGPVFIVSTVVTLTGGTLFLMWLGEQVTSRGIGNGISLIIFAGIIAGLPGALVRLIDLGRTTDAGLLVVFVFLMAILVILIVVFFERAQRRLLVQYPKRQVGNRMMSGETSHLPLKVNVSGVIPPIFASSLLLMPMTAASFSQGATGDAWWQQGLGFFTTYIQHGQPAFMALYAGLIIFFAFFYTAIVFNPQDTAENLKKYGGFIPGYRPGQRTADYIDYVLTRLTVIGAAYLTFICLLPEFIIAGMPEIQSFYLGGTSLMIVVTVTMDTVAQLQGHLLAHQYEGLIKKARLRGTRR